MAEATKVEEAKPVEKKAKTAYFVSRVHAGLTLQVQKMVKRPDGTEEQQVDEQATFTQYYDTWKGDVIRVGYLATDSEKIAKAARADDNVAEISEKEYKEAVENLDRAPVPAV